MSTKVTKKSSTRFKVKKSSKRQKTLEESKDVPETKPSNLPVMKRNGKNISYPCEYCTEVFSRELSRMNHTNKCPNRKKNTVSSDDLNNTIDCELLDSSGSSIENNAASGNHIPKIKVSQNVTVKSTEKVQPKRETVDISIYDYDEDPMEDMTYSHEDNSNEDRKCKHCLEFFENPLDLLRHSRNCRVYPRKMLPPEEIIKYFDSPNRNFCPICAKPIKTRNFRSIFIKHLLVHTEGCLHECSICKKKFKRKDHMQSHKKRHIVCGV